MKATQNLKGCLCYYCKAKITKEQAFVSILSVIARIKKNNTSYLAMVRTLQLRKTPSPDTLVCLSQLVTQAVTIHSMQFCIWEDAALFTPCNKKVTAHKETLLLAYFDFFPFLTFLTFCKNNKWCGKWKSRRSQINQYCNVWCVYRPNCVRHNLFVLINYFFYKMERHQDERESTSQNANLVPWQRIWSRKTTGLSHVFPQSLWMSFLIKDL